jgi:hypothetical protein
MQKMQLQRYSMGLNRNWNFGVLIESWKELLYPIWAMGPGPRKVLENGHMQLLPSKDLGGRRVILNNVNHLGGLKDPLDTVRLATGLRPARVLFIKTFINSF